jgi:hypothetical protein
LALDDLSFKLYTDVGLTTLFGGTLQLVHNSSLADNPQDFTLYFGSTDETKQLDAYSNPGVDDVTLTPTDKLEDWDTATAYALGDLVEPTTPNGFVYQCTTAGTSHAATEPTWPVVGIGTTVSDGTAVWTFKGARHEITEIVLALDSGDLGTNTPGDPIILGTTLLGGEANVIPIYIRIENAVTTVRSNTGHAEIAIDINEVIETDV